MASQDFDQAEALLQELRTSYPNHALMTQKFRSDETSDTSTAVDRLLSRISTERAFRRDHPGLFENPKLAENAPRVKLTTDRGSIVIGLYADLAPKHVENFIKLVKDGYYVGTKFHGVFPGEYVRGGDPNSKDGDPSTWGQGGPDYTVESEVSPLRHFSGVLTSIPMPGDATKTYASQFMITTSDMHGLDVNYFPFGKVLEGMDVLLAIENAPMSESALNRPETPVVITATEVL